jgi:hypothetical protein
MEECEKGDRAKGGSESNQDMSAGSSITRRDLRSPIVTIYVSLAVFVL